MDNDQTFASLEINEARRRIGHDAIIRDDPYFGRRGLVKDIAADERHGFLVLVLIYKRTKTRSGRWELLDKPGDLARAYWPPGKVQIA